MALPLEEESYVLNKEEFRDALCLRYDLPLKNLPSKCPCNQPFNIPHAMTCKKGGFIHMRHNDLRNLEAGLLNEVCRNVAIEPRLLPLTGEVLSLSSANTEDNARLDIKTRGFFREGQTAYFDIRVTNLKAPSYQNKSTETVLKNAEQEKKRSYNQRVIEVEHGSFTPLVFGSNGAMGKECITFHKKLAAKIAEKRGKKYHEVISDIRTKISFKLQKSMILCIRGSRTVF